MPVPFPFDFRKPDYIAVFKHRAERLKRLRQNPEILPGLRKYYKDNPIQFINDWGTTFDPRNVDVDLPALIPFILFPRQEEWAEWFLDHWKNKKPGLTDKSRDMGMSWLSLALACTLCLFRDGMIVGVGSRKEEYVDTKGDPKSMLYKARQFISNLPKEFRGTWDQKKHAPYMRIEFPDTQSVIAGEAGDGVGRGARASFYIVDESAWFPRPELMDASLSLTTNCRMDISTPRGMSNPFARKRFAGKVDVFSFHWRDDPRKDDAWYQKICDELDDPVVVAQEVDLDYSASIEGVLIPSAWVHASINAHIKLGIKPTGERKAALDVADEGRDKNGFGGRYGILVEYLEQWSGKGSDIFQTVEKVFNLCDMLDYDSVDYDADGLGAGIRGDARVVNARRKENKQKQIKFNAFWGSGGVVNPEGDPFQRSTEQKDSLKGRTNEDFFANYKAQAWWALRRRFQYTYRAVIEKMPYCADDIISISSSVQDCHKLITELSQPTYSQNTVGKIVVNKTPDGTLSPNLADTIVILFAPVRKISRGFFSV